MKYEYISMLQRFGAKIFLGRLDGLVLELPQKGVPSTLLQMDNFGPLALAQDDARTLVSGLIGEEDCLLVKMNHEDKIYKLEENVRFFVGPDYCVNDDFCLCRINTRDLTPLMPLDLLDSEPLVYDVSTSTHGALLAIARYGTIYTIDCSCLSSYNPLTFSLSEGEIFDKMRAYSERDDDSTIHNKNVGEIKIEYGDPDEDEELIEENKYFDKIIDPRLPIRAHDPRCHISALKLINLSPDGSILVASASKDHHIAVHDFSTHEKLYDSGWIDTCGYCCAQSNKKVIFGGGSGRVAVLDLDGFKLQEYKLPTDYCFSYAVASGDLAALYTLDNSVMVVDLKTMKVVDVFAPTVKLTKMCLAGRNLFMLNEELELTIEQI